MRWLSQEEQGVWRHLLTVECRLRERLDDDLRTEHGLTLGDYDVLVHLSEAEKGSLRMSELASRLLLSRSGLTRRLDGLVREGLVARKACPEDRRGALAELTRRGWERIEQAAPTHVAGVRRYVIDALGDLTGLAAGLERIETVLSGTDGVRSEAPASEEKVWGAGIPTGARSASGSLEQ
jgi:DNA-binding MarR family transcriptional regulator